MGKRGDATPEVVDAVMKVDPAAAAAEKKEKEIEEGLKPKVTETMTAKMRAIGADVRKKIGGMERSATRLKSMEEKADIMKKGKWPAGLKPFVLPFKCHEYDEKVGVEAGKLELKLAFGCDDSFAQCRERMH